MTAERRLLLCEIGGDCPFRKWFFALRDARTRSAVITRLNRVRLGNFGDCRSVGSGVEELRIDFGPGYRVYFARQGEAIVVLLAGGSKKTQRNDIRRAQQYWKEHQDAEGKSSTQAF